MKKGVGGKSSKKNSKKTYNNRLLYSLVAFGILIAATATTYALTAGVAPANGHTLSSVSAPSGCGSNTYIEWTGSGWSCSTMSSIWSVSGSNAYYNSGNVSIGATSSPYATLQLNHGMNVAGSGGSIGFSSWPGDSPMATISSSLHYANPSALGNTPEEGSLVFSTRDTNNVLSPRMTIDYNGNVNVVGGLSAGGQFVTNGLQTRPSGIPGGIMLSGGNAQEFGSCYTNYNGDDVSIVVCSPNSGATITLCTCAYGSYCTDNSGSPTSCWQWRPIAS